MPRRHRAAHPLVRLLAAPAVAVVLVAGCGDDGRQLAEPQGWQTTTTRPQPPTSAAPQDVSETGFALASPDFEPGGPVPVDATCAGANRHPALEWSGAPGDAVELAVTLSDQSDPAEPVLLWLVAGIDPATTSLPAGELPAGAIETANDYGVTGWGSPCLEALGGGIRPLQFRIHALPRPSGLAPGAAGNEAWELVSASAVDDAAVTMTLGAAG